MPYEALPEVHWPEINITRFNNSDVLQDFEQLDVELEQLVDQVEMHKTLWISENDKIQNDLSKIQASGGQGFPGFLVLGMRVVAVI